MTAGTERPAGRAGGGVTARVMGANAELIADVGVAGIHRRAAAAGAAAAADVVVVVAGMDGALPSVVGGLVDCPVIAVPDEHRLRGGVRRRRGAADDAEQLLGRACAS